MTDDLITIEVDGKPLQARKGQMLIQVTDENDIYVPRFCYHNKLSVAANCRMCLVEVEKAPKPLPACATPVMEGMKVFTRSELALEAQKSVMEFLLINHPLDCPICDQGGECELQDLAMGYGNDVSRYQEKKRVVKDKDIGPLVHTDMTRCIHCTRCIRFGEEIAGMRELGGTGRGENLEIGTYIAKSMASEMSGNVIDLCPVGALTSKPFRFSARTWELVQRNSIAPHDSVGSNIHYHIKDDRVKRVAPAENESINEVWLSDRDRFSYEGLYSDDRLQVPMIKENKEWKEVDWETALEFAKQQLQSVTDKNGGDSIGALASPSATLEELYLFQKFVRGIGCNNIDHRLRQCDFSDQDGAPVFPALGQAIKDIEKNNAVLLIGSNVRKDQPIINHRLRKAVLNGCNLMLLNPIDYSFNYDIAAKLIVTPSAMVDSLAGILKALLADIQAEVEDGLMKLINTAEVTDAHRTIANNLHGAECGIVLLGNLATAHPQYSTLRALAGCLAKLCHVSFGYLSEGANSSGAWLAGVLPHRNPAGEGTQAGLDARAMLEEQRQAYITMGVEPEIDCWDGGKALKAFQSADFVLVLTAYRNEAMNEYADVMLPIALSAETSGTYINIEGTSQSFSGVVPPQGETRPAWKVLRVLGNYFDIDGFTYTASTHVHDEVLAMIGDIEPDNEGKWKLSGAIQNTNGALQRVTEIPMNSIDPQVRRAQALQQTADKADDSIHINSSLAGKLGLAQDERGHVEQGPGSAMLPVTIDDRIPDGCVLIQAGQASHTSLGAWYGDIKISKG
jgi:NADH-quinone oxidoreductase subunit G